MFLNEIGNYSLEAGAREYVVKRFWGNENLIAELTTELSHATLLLALANRFVTYYRNPGLRLLIRKVVAHPG